MFENIYFPGKIKNSILVGILFAFILLINACDEDKVVNNNNYEQILSISQRWFAGECQGYCDKLIIIDSLNTRDIQKSIVITPSLPTLDSNYKTDKTRWNDILSLININAIMKLDSIYPPVSEKDEPAITLILKTNIRTKSITLDSDTYLPEIDSLNKYILKLRGL